MPMQNHVDVQFSPSRQVAAATRIVSDAVGCTLGPAGRTVIFEQHDRVHATKDGATVADRIWLSGGVGRCVAAAMRDNSRRVVAATGDGTTTTTILTEALMRHMRKLIDAGWSPQALTRQVLEGAELVDAWLAGQATPVERVDELVRVATVSSGDEELGQVVGESMAAVGADGVVTVELGYGMETTWELEEGVLVECDVRSGADGRLEQPLVALVDGIVDTTPQMGSLLELALEQGRPIIVLAERLSPEAVAMAAENTQRGVVEAVAAKLKAVGQRQRELMEDIAVATGATVLGNEEGVSIVGATREHLGGADDATVLKSKGRLVLGEGYGETPAILQRIRQLRQSIETASDPASEDRHSERLARLTASTVQIRVGGATEVEQHEKQARVEDALNATRVAADGGIVAGGGLSLVRAEAALDLDVLGHRVLADAMVEPLRRLAASQWMEPDLVVAQVKRKPFGVGLNARTKQYEDLLEAGIYDPALVVREALRHAVSTATTLMSAKVWLTR